MSDEIKDKNKIVQVDGIDGSYKYFPLYSKYLGIKKGNIFYDILGLRDYNSGKANITKEKYEEICTSSKKFLENYNAKMNENEKALQKTVAKNELPFCVYEYFQKVKSESENALNIIIDKVKSGEIYFNFQPFEDLFKDLYGSKEFLDFLNQLLNIENLDGILVPAFEIYETRIEYFYVDVYKFSTKKSKPIKVIREKIEYESNYIINEIKNEIDIDKGYALKIRDGAILNKYEDKTILDRQNKVIEMLEYLAKESLKGEIYFNFSALSSYFTWENCSMQEIYEVIADCVSMSIILQEREKIKEKEQKVLEKNNKETIKETTKKTIQNTIIETIKDNKTNIINKNTTENKEQKKDLKENKKIEYNNGVYSGETLNGIRHGQGTYKYNNGDIYTGEWKNGKKEGFGKLSYSHGNSYEGHFKNGVICGRGIYNFANGTVYDGYFQNGQFNGLGIIKFTNGDKYFGLFENSYRKGFGKYTYANGTYYIGTFDNNKLDGFGAFYRNDSSITIGQWNENEFDPDEVSISNLLNDSKYIHKKDEKLGEYFGEVYNLLSQPNGLGIRIYQNTLYMGNFTNGKECGHGILLSGDGWSYTGHFLDGECYGQGKIVYVNGTSREGNFINGKLNGKVQEYDENGEFIGEFDFINDEKQ